MTIPTMSPNCKEEAAISLISKGKENETGIIEAITTGNKESLLGLTKLR